MQNNTNIQPTTVVDILISYFEWEKLKNTSEYQNLSSGEKDKIRLENDNDARYYRNMELSYEKALLADTIVSFWTPYKRMLCLEAKWNSSKTEKSLKSLLYQINLNGITDTSRNIIAVNNKFENFAKICYSKGNFMLLPNRAMNNKRYSVTEDRIDMTLYECFEKGALATFFYNEEQFIEWVKSEKLSFIFSSGQINKDKILWLVNEGKPKWISEMNSTEIIEYISNAIKLISERTEFLNSH